MKRIYKKIAVMSLAIMSMIFSLSVSAAAANVFGEAPDGMQTDQMKTIMQIVFWIVRAVIAVSGLIPGLMKLIGGFSDEDDRKKNNGITILVITGAVIAASFVIESWFTSA